MSDPTYGVVAAFAARLAGLGVADAVISPGSRSTPLTVCLDAQTRISTWIQLDERSAGFFALGLGRATGRPAVLVCTSGTAAANYLPAVVEASHAGIPMIVCTADRPPELRGWGSPQTIDQVGLYGTAVRWSIDLPVPSEATDAAAIRWAETAVGRATGSDPGPVHLNWPLREPLEPPSAVPSPRADPTVASPVHDEDAGEKAGQEAAVPGGDASQQPGHEAPEPGDSAGQAPQPGQRSPELVELAEIVAAHERGVVVAGPWPGGGLHRERQWAAAVRRFAAWAGWPVIGEPITHLRGDSGDGASPGDRSCVIATADHLLADAALGEELRPDVAVLVGRTVTTKPVRLWLERTRPDHVVLIDPEDRWERAVFRLTGHVPASVEDLGVFVGQAASAEALRLLRPADPPVGAAGSAEACTARPERTDPGGWLDTWRRLDAAARGALDGAIGSGPLLSALAARTLARSLPPGSVLVASNSMPVRDLDDFVLETGSLWCCANRGAAGIDGTTSTALGIAAADASRVVALHTGDLALLHDLSGLTAAARLGLHLLAVCVDNDGGGIFSLLPIAQRVPVEDFERLFRTPHGLDLRGLDGFGGIRARRVATAGELGDAVAAAAATRAPGVDLLVVDIPHDDDVAQRRALTAAAQQAAGHALARGPDNHEV